MIKICNKLGIEGNFLDLIKGRYKSLECGKRCDAYLDARQHHLIIAFLILAWFRMKIPGNTIYQVVLISSDNPETSSW